MTVHLETMRRSDLLWEMYRVDLWDVRTVTFSSTYNAADDEPSLVDLIQLSHAVGMQAGTRPTL